MGGREVPRDKMRIIRIITPIRIFILTLVVLLTQKIVQSVWTPMLFLVIGAAILDFGLMLLVDYFLIRNMLMKYLWVVEFVIVLFLVLVKLYNNLSLYDMIFLIY